MHKQSKVYELNLKEIHKKHKEEISELMRKFWKLDDILISRDLQIQDLEHYLIKDEELISYNRIESLYKPPKEENPDIEKILAEKSALQSQLDTLKEFVKEYEKNIDDLKLRIKIMDYENRLKIEELEKEKSELVIKFEKAEEVHLEYIRKLDEKYKDFKNDIKTELEVRNCITNRQNQVILALKQDITSAKKVLDTPRLLYKYNDKFSNYHKHNQSVYARPNRSHLPSKANLKQRKFNSIETLISTRCSPIFTLTPDLEYPSSILPTLSEYEYYR